MVKLPVLYHFVLVCVFVIRAFKLLATMVLIYDPFPVLVVVKCYRVVIVSLCSSIVYVSVACVEIALHQLGMMCLFVLMLR